MELLKIADKLAMEVGRLIFSPPVTHVYNPLVYARRQMALYLDRFGRGKKEAVFVGMNPGPWGMAQTGVPFGEIGLVREWLGINGDVGKPPNEHPRKRVEGFACRRSEVSGRRLWGLFRAHYDQPERFFARFFVLNYCPLLFVDAEGRNITPDRLRQPEQDQLLVLCDIALRESLTCLGAGRVIGVGNFAAKRAEIALAGLSVPVGRILHPSPANPGANRNWEEKVLQQLQEQGVEL